MMTRMVRLFAGSVSLALTALPAAADPPNTLCGAIGCQKATNFTGQTANDFHMQFGNLAIGFFNGALASPGWGAAMTPVNGGSSFRVDWTGGTAAPGQTICVGVRLAAGANAPQIHNALDVRAWWTLDGVQIGQRVPVPGFRWVPTSTGGGVSTGLHGWNINQGDFTVQVQRRVNTVPGLIDMETLVNDAMIYDEAIIIDAELFEWAPSEVIGHDFELVSDDVTSYIMIYDLYELNGAHFMTMYDVAYALPGYFCPADLNGDNTLDFFDVQFYLNAFSSGQPVADMTNDGVLDFFDVQAFLNSFSAGCP